MCIASFTTKFCLHEACERINLPNIEKRVELNLNTKDWELQHIFYVCKKCTRIFYTHKKCVQIKLYNRVCPRNLWKNRFTKHKKEGRGEPKY